jgi:hypothetical protein
MTAPVVLLLKASTSDRFVEAFLLITNKLCQTQIGSIPYQAGRFDALFFSITDEFATPLSGRIVSRPV